MEFLKGFFGDGNSGESENDKKSQTLTALMLQLRDADRDFFMHSLRTAGMVEGFGIQYGLSGDEVRELKLAGKLHDLGIGAIPPEIVWKVKTLRPLDEVESELYKTHVDYTLRIIKDLDFLTPNVLSIIRHHHERFDGTGYPDRLRATEIPLGARILSIVNFFDKRRFDMGQEKVLDTIDAVEEVEIRSGSYFDPDLVDFLTIEDNNWRTENEDQELSP